jgi:predicted flap endonuclease-1-like 5' DNA nuclease
MPEINVIHIAIISAMTVVGTIIGWILRGNRSREEKAAVSSGWQEQLKAQRTEHDRLTDQNKGLMEQINQYQASNSDAKNRARELSVVVQEAFSRRDDLQREIKDIRGNLEVAVNERDQLQSSISSKDGEIANIEAKDTRITKLQLELENWQNRLPPLIEKFRQRNEDVERLETELNAARDRIVELESETEESHTRIEPVSDPDTLTNGRDASNDPNDDDELEAEAEAEAAAEFAPLAADDDDGATDDFPEEEEEEEEEEEDVVAAINGARDKLQAIKGVGPAIEKTLNEMGIFRFQQIADMSEYDIDRIAKRLKGFRSRIYREDWIGQARELRDQDSGD